MIRWGIYGISKKIYCDLIKLYDVCSFTFAIKEWHEFYHWDIMGFLVIILMSPFVFIFYPLLKVFHNVKMRRVHMNGDVYELKKRRGIRFYVPNMREDIMQGYYLLADDYHDHNILPKLCKKFIKKNSVICDIGGNVGNHTIFFTKNCKPQKIYTFEPVKETFDILEKNVRLNHVEDKVEIMNVGLGSRLSSADIKIVDARNTGANRVRESKEGKIKIITLDSLNLGKVDFFKIDVEGFEHEVIMGGEKLCCNRMQRYLLRYFRKIL